MADELELDLETPDQREINREKSRNKGLSEKVIATAKERDEANAKAQQLETEKAAALKDAEFYKNFSTASSKYPGANEYQDKIREKAALGLDVEEATMLVMAKEGKYVVPPPMPVPKQSPAGGSAVVNLKNGDQKPVSEMTQDERRAQLMEAERRGDISIS